jgi:hypothetical protein
MAFTLAQARPLLTNPELALFDASRAQPIKTLTPAKLRTKVTRARALRDKYRDLYRRQTVGAKTAAAAKRPVAGEENERTQRKADIFAEVLGRFEERLQKLQPDSAAASTAAA